MFVSRKTKAYTAITLIFTAMLLLSFSKSAKANSADHLQDTHPNHPVTLYQAELQTATPTPSSIEFTQEEIEEGRPVGIIIGAAILVIVIFLGSLLTLYRTKQKK